MLHDTQHGHVGHVMDICDEDEKCPVVRPWCTARVMVGPGCRPGEGWLPVGGGGQAAKSRVRQLMSR